MTMIGQFHTLDKIIKLFTDNMFAMETYDRPANNE